MKRAMGGGAHRGPPELRRQRRTMRLMQLLLVLISAGLIAFAGYSCGRVAGYEQATGESLAAPPKGSVVRTIVLVVLGAAALAGAWLLEGPGGTVRLPTPARLDELAGRAERTAIDRAEEAAADRDET